MDGIIITAIMQLTAVRRAATTDDTIMAPRLSAAVTITPTTTSVRLVRAAVTRLAAAAAWC